MISLVSVHPSTTKGHNDDVDNPIYADCLFRNEITSKWNNLLSNKCKENDIYYKNTVLEKDLHFPKKSYIIKSRNFK